MDVRECKEKGMIKAVRRDENLVSSLLESSGNRMKSEELLKMSEVTAGSKVSLAYDSLRELLEALAISNGFKVYNHECYSAFLKEMMNESYLGDEFDKIRKVRNAINYYGKSITAKEARSVIDKIKSLYEEVSEMLPKNKRRI